MEKSEKYTISRYEELDPIPQWSARLALQVPYDHFRQTLLRATAITNHRFTGVLTKDADENVTSFINTRFRRNKYGRPPSASQCLARLGFLAELFEVDVQPDVWQTGMSRIVIGLHEGQHETGHADAGKAPDHSAQEFAERLGEKYLVSESEVFNTRLEPGIVSYYAEPTATIWSPTYLKRAVYAEALRTAQERFSVEDFTPTGNWSYMVETWYCQEPDAPPADKL